MPAKILFFIGVAIDVIGLGAAVFMMVGDSLKGYRGTNNPTMFLLTLLVAGLVAVGFWLKNIGKLGFGTGLVWIPAAPLLLYGLFVGLFIILKPDMK